MELQCIFLKPTFPMIGNIEGCFIGAKSLKTLNRKLAEMPIGKDGHYDLIDCTGKVWSLYVDKMILSPLNFQKKRTKLEIIKLFNERENTALGKGIQYSEKSISAKRFDRILSDLVNLSTSHTKTDFAACPNATASGHLIVNTTQDSK